MRNFAATCILLLYGVSLCLPYEVCLRELPLCQDAEEETADNAEEEVAETDVWTHVMPVVWQQQSCAVSVVDPPSFYLSSGDADSHFCRPPPAL
ncbi:MAG: hypothetical protein KDA96_14285 [Planctomycetaceae bacterium]|nr:hypothetical protein [Planctomycetaceae bacterium]MCA9064234.1 hypothetical protein [Planctomycetaceae bacterium]